MDKLYFTIAICILICFFIAELFGRSKHIGRWWSFFLLLGGLLPGIIAIIVSPSAKKEPTRGGKVYNIWCWISLAFGILNLIQLYNSEGKSGQIFFVFFIIAFYLFELSKGEVINKDPKYYFQISNPISSNGKDVEKKEKPKKDLKGIIENLKELREDGLLSDLEYETKLNNVINEQNKDSVSESEEFLKLKKLFNAGILDNTEFENKTNILIERQSINIKKDSKNTDLDIASQPISPIKEFQSEKAIPPKQDNSWRNFIVFIAIFIGLTIFIGNSGVLKKPEPKEESYTIEYVPPAVYADTSTVTEPVLSQVKTDTSTVENNPKMINDPENINKYNGGYVLDNFKEYEFDAPSKSYELTSDNSKNPRTLFYLDNDFIYVNNSFKNNWEKFKITESHFDYEENAYMIYYEKSKRIVINSKLTTIDFFSSTHYPSNREFENLRLFRSSYDIVRKDNSIAP